jgi:hypothetical protein
VCVALLLLPTHLVERQKERDRESLCTHPLKNDKFAEGEPVKNLGMCLLPHLSLVDLVKHQNEREGKSLDTPPKNDRFGIGVSLPPG